MAIRSDELAHLLELLAPLGPLQVKRMFGGCGIYAGERFFAIVIDGELHLKTDTQTRAEFHRAGCRPFVYRTRGHEVATSYWSVPDDALDSAEAMRPWATLALEAAMRKPQSRQKHRRR